MQAEIVTGMEAEPPPVVLPAPPSPSPLSTPLSASATESSPLRRVSPDKPSSPNRSPLDPCPHCQTRKRLQKELETASGELMELRKKGAHQSDLVDALALTRGEREARLRGMGARKLVWIRQGLHHHRCRGLLSAWRSESGLEKKQVTIERLAERNSHVLEAQEAMISQKAATRKEKEKKHKQCQHTMYCLSF